MTDEEKILLEETAQINKSTAKGQMTVEEKSLLDETANFGEKFSALNAGVEGAALGLGVPSGLLNITKKQPAYQGTGAQIAEQVAGDVAGLATIPLNFGKTGLATGVNIAAGATTGGAMGATQAGDKLIKIQDDIYNFLENQNFKALPEPLKRSVLANLLFVQIPTIGQYLPAAVGPQVGLMALGQGTKNISPNTKAAMNAGIPVTQSIEPKLYPDAAAKEYQISKTYPQAYADFDKEKLAALKKQFQKLSPAITQTAEEVGGTAKKSILAEYERLGKEFSEAEKIIQETPTAKINASGQKVKNVGKSAAYNVYKYLVDNGITDVNIKKWTGNEKIKDIKLAKLISDRAKLLENAKSVDDLVQQKRQYWNAAETYLRDAPSSNRTQAREVYNLYNKAIADSLPEGPEKDMWLKTNQEFSEFSQAVERVAGPDKIDAVKAINNDKIFTKFITGGDAFATDDMKKLAGPKEVKNMAYQYLTYNPRTGQLLDVDTIKSRFEVFKNKGLDKAIFETKEITDIENLIKLGEYVENPLKPNPAISKRGGSQTAIAALVLGNVPGVGDIIKSARYAIGERSARDFLKTPPGDKHVFSGGRAGYVTDINPAFPAGVAISRNINKERADYVRKKLKINTKLTKEERLKLKSLEERKRK